MIACKTINNGVTEHFPDIRKMISLGKGAQREAIDYHLSRYACYLIAQNGDSRKKVIALAQTYFAVQTRKMELSEKEYNELSEDKKDCIVESKQRMGTKFYIKLRKKKE